MQGITEYVIAAERLRREGHHLAFNDATGARKSRSSLIKRLVTVRFPRRSAGGQAPAASRSWRPGRGCPPEGT